MALTVEQQKILEHALAALPDWFTSEERQLEFLAAAAKLMGNAKLQVDSWFDNTLILSAVGPTGSDPDWLNQHAVDRNTTRQAAETDEALRDRLRNVPDALTRPTLIAAIASILDAEVITYDPLVYPGMVEMPRDASFFRTLASDTGTGGTFATVGAGVVKFTPDTPFQGVPFRDIEEAITHKLVISGAATAGNDGTHVATGIDVDGVTYAPPGGYADEVDATVTWTVEKYDRDDNLMDGFQDAFFAGDVSPGSAVQADRMGQQLPGKVVIILPFGCTAGTLASVQEMLRQKKGAGVLALVECRLNA